ncbi:MAG: DPP IV N-terminal domain-containing protein, partial [Bacteroidia bacterium]|nr:DPP IV N-terminal domain-containing protein [Bacteroidia bacterium]
MKALFLSLAVLSFITINGLAQKSISVEDIWVNYEFYPKSAAGFNAMKDGIHYTDLEVDTTDKVIGIAKYDLKTGKKIAMIVNAELVKVDGKQIDISNYSFSPDETKLFFATETEGIYRRSSVEKNYVYDIKTSKITELSEKGNQMFATFSPVGNKVAFVRANNLFIKDLDSGKETQVTTDGKNNEIKNGWADWVYEEEFSKADYFEWNADGSKLAFVRFDESKVKEYTFDTYNNNLYPDKVTFKYPKAGEDNSILSVHIYDLANAKTTMVDIGKETDIYIPRIKWTTDKNTLSLQRMNRLQNKVELLFANANDGSTKTILTEEAKTYIDITDDLTFLPNNKGFIWSSEADNFNHLYYYDNTGKLVNQITKGNWDVVSFNGY